MVVILEWVHYPYIFLFIKNGHGAGGKSSLPTSKQWCIQCMCYPTVDHVSNVPLPVSSPTKHMTKNRVVFSVIYL